jgi:hypothetical protein
MEDQTGSPEIFGHLLVCDDIRHEVGNKPSYMGVYTGDILVEVFPFTLQKLCLIPTLNCSKDVNIESLDYWFRFDENTNLTQTITAEELNGLKGQMFPADSQKNRVMITLNLLLVPFNVSKPSEGTVGFTVNGKEILAGHVKVAQQI